MKKDNVWIGLIGLVVGGLIGYLVGAQSAWKERGRQVEEHTHESSNPPSGTSQPQGLPEGRAPVTTEADFETLKKAVERAPQNDALVTNLANKYYDAGRYEDAIRYYQRALTLDPGNISLMTDLGTAHFYAGRPDEAIGFYNRSLAIDPRHVQSLHNLVIVNLQGKKDPAAAKSALDQLKSVDPGNSSIANLARMIDEPVSKSGPSQPSANTRQRIF
ncbi:MAG: tetratricopeptide repeat protein [Terriglobia bacterium]